MMDLRRNIALNEPHVVDDVQTTNIATFATDIKAPIKSIKTYFNPIQTGSGTPSPDNVRPISGWNDIQMVKCGKNLFNVKATQSQCYPANYGNTSLRRFVPNTLNRGMSATNYLDGEKLASFSISDNSLTANCRNGYGLGYTFCLTPGETYTLSGVSDSEYHSIGVCYYTVDDTYISGSENFQFPKTFTVPSNAYITLLVFKSVGSGYNTDITYSNIQLEKGSTATSYEPYNGELFIYSPTEYTITPTTTTNLGVTWTINSDGTIDYEGTPTSWASCNPGRYYVRDPNEKIRIVIFGDTGNVVLNACNIYDANGTKLASSSEGSRHTVIDFSQYENAFFVSINLKRWNNVYMKGTCRVIITSSLDEMYGGYVDLVKGEVVAEWMRYAFTGDETFYNTGTWVTSFFPAAAKQPFSGYCSHYPYAPYSRGKIGVMINEKTCTFDGNIYDASGWKQFCKDQYDNSTPVMVAYRIREPIRYSLTPTQIKTLKGINNIWSDANGEIDVKYWKH